MIFSTNKNSEILEFEKLLENSKNILDQEATKKPDIYLAAKGIKLEEIVLDIMNTCAIGTPFKGTIERISGQYFPDIIANKFFGVEVKSTTSAHWNTIGNSVLESTRVVGIEKIFLMFGKLSAPISFKVRPYEECLSEVVVTHYPRYKVDMDLKPGETIFDKMGITYDNLRNSTNPVNPIADFYRKQIKDGQETLWWLDNGTEERSVPITIRLLNSLDIKEREKHIVHGMILFPEIFGKSTNKYNRFVLWLLENYGIISSSTRDSFTAGGKSDITLGEKTFNDVPKVFSNLANKKDIFLEELNSMDIFLLTKYWNRNISNKLTTWTDIVTSHSKNFAPKDFLKELFHDQGS